MPDTVAHEPVEPVRLMPVADGEPIAPPEARAAAAATVAAPPLASPAAAAVVPRSPAPLTYLDRQMGVITIVGRLPRTPRCG